MAPSRILILLFLAAVAAGGDAELRKRFRTAFKRLRIQKPAQAEKKIVPALPKGIVTEPEPFHDLIRGLSAPLAGQLAEREAVVKELQAHPTMETAKLLRSALAIQAKERALLEKSIADVEQSYAGVYNRGIMEAGANAARTRRLAAVLIPHYRELLQKSVELRGRMAAVFAGMRQGAELAWLTGAALSDRDAAVRLAAIEGLERMQAEPAREALRGALLRDPDAENRTRALGALMVFKVALVKEAVIASLGDKAWEVRTLAIAICARANLVEAVAPLIEALARERGRLRKDIDDALFALVGVRMQGDVELWRNWIAANGEKVTRRAKELTESGEYEKPLGPVRAWEARDAEEDAETPERLKGRTSAFYGIRTLSNRILFIVDISRSMKDRSQSNPGTITGKRHPYARPTGETKLAIARWQLHRAVHDLPSDAHFNILVYSESYKVWQEKMTLATKGAKKKAHLFVDGLNGNGVTNICDPIEKALRFPADTIFLLSDGNPNRGRITDLNRLLDHLRKRSALRRVVYHTVGIGEVADSSFLKELARRTGGHYVGFR
ncbi:MAG: HEAT repeat domain-containing protein [Planctomycetota bacterium]